MTITNEALVVESESGEMVRVPYDLLLYFDMDPLPCPVVGCVWDGQVLAQHLNQKHCISAPEMRLLIGPKRGQGICTKAYSSTRADLNRNQPNNPVISGEARFPLEETARHYGRPATRQSVQVAVEVRKSEAVREKMRRASEKSSGLPERRELSRKTMLQTRANEPTIIKICEECEEPYEAMQYQADRSRWCSQRCRNNNNNRKLRKNLPMVIRICEECEEPYEIHPSKVDRGRTSSKFCSQRCRQQHNYYRSRGNQ